MLFNSIPFLFFLSAVVVFYNILPSKYRSVCLLIASYVFYGINGFLYLLYLWLVTIISYSGAIAIEKKRNRQMIQSVSILFTLSFLLFFKYTDFGITIVNDLSLLWGGDKFEVLHLIVPVGISFYSFVAVGYLIDVSKGNLKAERNIIKYALFVSYFPAILSGPIERACHFLPQIRQLDRTTYQNAREGFVIFLWGLLFKVVMADRLALCANYVFSDVYSCQGLSLLMGSLAFTFQIYFDFAGYSYMAIGISRFFNIHLINNFNKPYLSVSLTDFWRRWHISLTSWFRDYIYIPLGGNRVSQLKWTCNILIVFLISGLWHGAYYTYIIWGGLHAVAQIVEKYVIKNKAKRIGTDRGRNVYIITCRVVLTFSIVSIAWIFFRSSSVNEAFYMLNGIFSIKGYSIAQLFTFKGTYMLFGMSILDTILSVIFVVGIIFLEIFLGRNNEGLAIPQWCLGLCSPVRWFTYVAMTLIVLWFGKLGMSEFVYFNF